MCVGRCSRIVGPCLLVLGALSVVASILLLFPGGAWQYLMDGHISRRAKIVPGTWGGGIMVSTMPCTGQGQRAGLGGLLCSPFSPQATFSFLQVLLAATHITAVGWRCACCSDCGTRRNAFLSVVLSKLALLGSAACFFFSGLGLTDGPLCLYNSTEPRNGLIWDYPFVDTPGNRGLADSYLFYPSTWGTCLEPVGIVTWHVTFFSLLLLVSAAEMVLAFLQIINGCAGCLCGFCERKEAGLSRAPGVR
ncbi:transmembrane 4 L6 family member 19 isoform X1 [Numida meleagris]|uniref:transmembrane 4 L6 family member 19 isoform X1 n=1 Tax=Numida meleagris TaxID=8996 RepID=UPI000B3DB3A2|nr:transmembrane 4 L6 family member 19 isoform X1 [Numida meleagris]